MNQESAFAANVQGYENFGIGAAALANWEFGTMARILPERFFSYYISSWN